MARSAKTNYPPHTQTHNTKSKQAEARMKSRPLELSPVENHNRTHRAIAECISWTMQQHPFVAMARMIFSKNKEIISAQSGFVALMDESVRRLEIIHLDPVEKPDATGCESSLPIRGFRRKVLQKKQTLCCNNFMASTWRKILPGDHMNLQNVLIAPIVIKGAAVGIFAFANKPQDFDQDDILISTSFAHLAAMALQQSKAWHLLQGGRTAG